MALILVGLCWLPLVCAMPAANGASRPQAGGAETACSLASRLEHWSDRRLAEQTIVVPVDATSVSDVGVEVRSGVGGILLLGSSASPLFAEALHQLVATARGGVAPFVMLDEEGGAVERIPNLLGPIPSARQVGATLNPAQIRALAARLGARLRSLGVTMDLAPVLDVDGGPGPDAQHPDGTRSFSADPAVAAADGVAFATGLASSGVVPVVKHFPGLGGASGNTDFAVASTPPLVVLRRIGLVPFEAAIAARLPAVMVSDAIVPGLSSIPADLSPSVVEGLLRHTLGFHGLVVTDALSTPSIQAAGYTTAAASVAAIRAGSDLVLFASARPRVASTTSAIVSSIVAAVTEHRLARSRLVRAVADTLIAKGQLPLCPT